MLDAASPQVFVYARSPTILCGAPSFTHYRCTLNPNIVLLFYWVHPQNVQLHNVRLQNIQFPYDQLQNVQDIKRPGH
jgi:hypothetical protein